MHGEGIIRFAKLSTICGVVTLLNGCVSKSPEPPPGPASVVSRPNPAATNGPANAKAAPRQQRARLTPEDILKQAAFKPSAPFEGEGWRAMFNGRNLAGWRETAFAGRGEIQCKSGMIILNMGDPFTGVDWTNEFPTMNYEVALDAMRVTGSDFFCGLTVPVDESFCSLIVGGWGGGVVGISSLDGLDASENDTTKYVNFETGRWYRIRLRVTEGKIEGWIDTEKLIDASTTGKKISVRPGEIEMCKPFGVASWETGAALREIRMRRLP